MGQPYVPFYTSDFLGGTSGMTAATKGIYITLLCLMYESEGPLPQKWDTLARRCGCTLPAFKRAVSDLQDDGKIEETDAGLWSDKCDKHITHRRERSSSATASAKKRWQKTQQKQSETDANALPSQCQPEPEPDIEKEETKVSSKKTKRATSIADGWKPTEADTLHALQKQFSPAEIEDMADGFRNHHLAKGSTFKDWAAAWRTWVGNARKYSGGAKAIGYASNRNRPENAIVAEVLRRRTA